MQLELLSLVTALLGDNKGTLGAAGVGSNLNINLIPSPLECFRVLGHSNVKGHKKCLTNCDESLGTFGVSKSKSHLVPASCESLWQASLG